MCTKPLQVCEQEPHMPWKSISTDSNLKRSDCGYKTCVYTAHEQAVWSFLPGRIWCQLVRRCHSSVLLIWIYFCLVIWFRWRFLFCLFSGRKNTYLICVQTCVSSHPPISECIRLSSFCALHLFVILGAFKQPLIDTPKAQFQILTTRQKIQHCFTVTCQMTAYILSTEHQNNLRG